MPNRAGAILFIRFLINLQGSVEGQVLRSCQYSSNSELYGKDAKDGPSAVDDDVTMSWSHDGGVEQRRMSSPIAQE